ncbi:alpha-mannosyltransferase [Grosmannia clavigera kw1407]|uniref:Alpha-mannosyltransferase n=1 Tax=Grosmannia clavigera (strain kw1407 / UAMH 11150) TaxID=655863 RepID=F0XIC0_GROCL|nr:alpha-mannosyltransferase [Grosmannia clavigera kw1407]EFX02570.1 alpha-mannosyltransferase [Grosmannia clavigera kw1407]
MSIDSSRSSPLLEKLTPPGSPRSPTSADTSHSWLERNPDYRFEVLTDGNELPYVEYHFGPEGFNRPDIVDFYRNVRATIVRADLLRYMIMYAEGGVYADIDVEAIKPMSRFIPDRYNVRDIDMVVGVEIDEPDWKDHPILGPKSRSFCQWTFMCKPQIPVMMRLIEQIMHWLNGVAQRQGVSISEVVLDFDEIITGTGPSAFTEAILDYINEGRAGNNLVSWDHFHDLSESKLVSGVLVLTVEAFAAGQGHSDSGNHDARAALVRHHYHASNWPSRHPRYRHPVYGEVEKCNWNDDCVHQWDADVAAFKNLPENEQRRLIEEHERQEKEKEEEDRRRLEQQEEEERRNREDEENRRAAEEEERNRREEQNKLEEKANNKPATADEKKTETEREGKQQQT